MINDLKEVVVAVSTLDEHKAEGIETLDVSSFSPFCSAYVLATAPNPRALGAWKDILEDEFIKNGFEVSVSEGNPDSGWVIVGAGEVIVHLFLEANRREINLAELVSRLVPHQA